jgi:hypothetical protein
LKVALIFSVLSALLFTTPASAQSDGMPSRSHWSAGYSTPKKVVKHRQQSNRRVARVPVRVNTRTASLSPIRVLPHPKGCPRRLFCGCGASMHLFGTVKPGLMLAANWLRFPRATPGPGTVAARRGHVFVIDKVLSNGMVMAYNYNGAGGRSTYQALSLRGYTVVNPKG